MSKIVSIRENGEQKQFTTSKIKTLLTDGTYAYWVPEDELDLIQKTITENGTYNASDDGYQGYSTVTVNVENSGGVLHGTTAPSSSLGQNGYVYLQWDEDEDATETPSEVTALGYKYVGYLTTSSAGAYVNLGPLGLSVGVGISVEFSCDTTLGVSGGLFGANVSDDTDLCLTAENGNIVSSLEGQTVTVTASAYGTDEIETDTYRNTLINTPNQSKLYFVGIPETAFPSSDVYLMAVNGGSGAVNFKVYSVQIKSNGEYLMYLHPARRLSDSMYGFFDSRNNVFYPNVGSGEFVAPHEGTGEITAVYYKQNGVWRLITLSDLPSAGGNYFGRTSDSSTSEDTSTSSDDTSGDDTSGDETISGQSEG